MKRVLGIESGFGDRESVIIFSSSSYSYSISVVFFFLFFVNVG